MTSDTVNQVTRRDVSLVRQTLLRLTATQKLVCVLAVVIAVVAALLLAQRVLIFGQEIDYSALHMLGESTLDLLREYNPFFWWAAAIVIALLILYLLIGFVAATQRRARSRLVKQHTAQQLVSGLSPTARTVLAWSWSDTREPMTVGVLQRALTEMRSGRAAKINLARQHAELFKQEKTDFQASLMTAQDKENSDRSLAL